jgi:hypothetical protein
MALAAAVVIGRVDEVGVDEVDAMEIDASTAVFLKAD